MFKRNPLIIIDVAHNKASFEALFNTMLEIKRMENFKSIILVLGIKYKNMEEIFNTVSKFSELISTIILTKPNYELAAEPEYMKKFLNFENVFSTGNVKDAIEMALNMNKTKTNGTTNITTAIVIAGSFFTAAEGKKYLKI